MFFLLFPLLDLIIKNKLKIYIFIVIMISKYVINNYVADETTKKSQLLKGLQRVNREEPESEAVNKGKRASQQ